MSDHVSNGTNDEDIATDKNNPGESPATTDAVPTPKIESKAPTQVNFGRPRKHPYKPGKYKCEYCDVMCSKPSVLKKHRRAHTNERPYPCGVCKRSFKTKSNLSKHMKSKSHSSKIPSNKEKKYLILQALSGEELEPNKTIVDSTNNIEYDCVDKSITADDSPATSCDDRSIASEDISTEESPKRGEITYPCQNKLDDLQDNERSSCSGMLTINSLAGPITVEVEIKLETMKQLQQGFTNMVMKKYSPSSPGSSLLSRNDADVRAAESILHMANQRPNQDLCSLGAENRASPISFEHKLITPKEEYRRIDSSQSTDALFASTPPYVGLSPSRSKPTKPSPLNYSSKSISRNRTANKSIPNEDQKKLKKCLVESLLKRMQRKSEISTKHVENPHTNLTYCTGSSVIEREADSTPTSSSSVVYNCMSQKKTFNFNSNHLKVNALISDSNSPSCYSVNSSLKQTVVQKRAVPSNSRSTNFQTTPNQVILLAPSYHDSKQSPRRINSPIPATGYKVDSTSDVYPITLNNSPNLYQNRACNVTTQTSSTSSQAVPFSVQSVKEESIIQQEDPVSPDDAVSPDDSEHQSNIQPTSNPATHESDASSSPRLCIVEDPVDIAIPINKNNTESDEEIDVVNTDSDEEESTMKRTLVKGRILSIINNKKRKGGVQDFEGGFLDCEAKKLKEIEKPVTPHAPNINAKDLVQDCPLNLSANRQPIIMASCAQPPQVLENIYRPTMSANNIAALTNTNPAHPHSIPDVSRQPSNTNGHPHDYPIFEDKVRCEVCDQMIEPSKLQLHKSMHIYTDGRDTTAWPSSTHQSESGSTTKPAFNKPRTYRCVVCNTGFRVMGHLSKHHKSKSHLQGLVNSGLLSKTLNAKIEESKVPIGDIIDQKTGNIIPEVLKKYLSDWSQTNTDSDS